MSGAAAFVQSSTWAEVQCTTLESDSGSSVVVTTDPFAREGRHHERARMPEARTVECARLAEATNDPGLRQYLTKLASSWMQATTTADPNERLPVDGAQRRRLKTLQDLFY